jgi:hypothetical protein
LFSSSSSSAAVIVVARYFFIAMLLISVVVGNVVVVVIPHEIRWWRHPHYNIPLRIAMAIIRDNIVAHSRRHRPDDNDDDTLTLSFCPYRTGRKLLPHRDDYDDDNNNQRRCRRRRQNFLDSVPTNPPVHASPLFCAAAPQPQLLSPHRQINHRHVSPPLSNKSPPSSLLYAVIMVHCCHHRMK